MRRTEPWTLITIPFSHYCEKARWSLQYAKLPFAEEAHAPVVHYLANARRRAGATVPVLVTPGKTYCDSTDILEFVDSKSPGLLYPQDAQLGKDVRALEDLFDEKYGPGVRRWIYFYLLDRPDLALPMFHFGGGALSRAAIRAVYPLIRTGIRKALKIDAAAAARSRQRVYDILKHVEALLADGRRYLAGERFTAADLTFAALSGPLFLISRYGVPLPAFQDLPDVMQKEVTELRARPSGQFVARIYEEHRGH